MAATIKALFPSRREVELAVEHLVQEYGIERTDIFIEPTGPRNSSGESATVDASGSRVTSVDTDSSAYAGQLQVSVDMNDDETDAVASAFRETGAIEVRRN